MKRFSLMLIAVCLIGLAGLMVTGCGQSVPTVSTTSSPPKGLTIRGTVYAYNLSWNRSVPLAGVTLFLSGDKVSRTTTSNADGEYSFTDLPSNNSLSGGYNIVATKECYQRRIVTGLNFGGGSTAAVPDNSVLTYDISLISDPVVLDILPYPGATIEAGVNTITVKFNEVMDVSSVRPLLYSMGPRTFAIADTQTLTTTWSADSKTLYVTTGALLANEFYGFEVDPGYIAKDREGNLLDTTGSGDGAGAGGLSKYKYNNSGTSESYYYRTASGGAPGAPTGVLLTVHSKTAIDYADAATGTFKVNLAWLAPSAGNLTGYKVYVGKSSSGPWERLPDDTDSYLVRTNSFQSDITRVNETLYGGTYNADCMKMLAFVTDPVYFRVVAYNAEGETAATAVATRDATKPTVAGAPAAGAYRNPGDAALVALGFPASLAAALTDYTATATLNMGCYIPFSEPMNIATLTDPTKYVLTAGNCTAANVVYNSGGLTIVQLAFSASYGATNTVEVSASGPSDLSGNRMDSSGSKNVAAIQ